MYIHQIGLVPRVEVRREDEAYAAISDNFDPRITSIKRESKSTTFCLLAVPSGDHSVRLLQRSHMWSWRLGFGEQVAAALQHKLSESFAFRASPPQANGSLPRAAGPLGCCFAFPWPWNQDVKPLLLRSGKRNMLCKVEGLFWRLGA